MSLESCTRAHGASKSYRDQENVDYSPRKRPEMLEITSFDDAARVVYRGSRGIEILSGPENRGLTKTTRMLEITSFDDAARVVYGGHGASKSSRDQKNVDYSPRKRPEMLEITSFDDAARVV